MSALAIGIGIRVAVLGVVGFAVLKARPSTLLRVAEDDIGNAVQGVANVWRRTKNEYKARMYAKATEAIRKADADFEAMTPAQRKQQTRDEAAILARSAEILAARNGKPVRNRRRSSSAGHEATA